MTTVTITLPDNRLRPWRRRRKRLGRHWRAGSLRSLRLRKSRNPFVRRTKLQPTSANCRKLLNPIPKAGPCETTSTSGAGKRDCLCH